jgi:hypothetical protein
MSLDPNQDGAIYVANAGLALLNPFLPRFFELIGVLHTDDAGKPRISDPHSASRAVHLLQYLVDERLDTPEPELAFNKLLCGISVTDTIMVSISPEEADIELCEQLLKAVTANWPSIANVSASALRETFLQRAGRLQYQDGRSQLSVERKTLDVLVDQIPWAFSIIYHPWMATPIHVTW